MVLAVCQRLLQSTGDAEDAFQATFLVLIRKAGSIGRGAAVGPWLYRVAYRVALRARAARARRARREQSDIQEMAAPPGLDPAWHDFRQVLDEEVNRLPARQRAVFVLCCLEGKTGAEVARQLGLSPGTVSSRLTRARQRLRRGLTRRGLAPGAGAWAAALTRESQAASIPAGLIDSTLRGARLFASGKDVAGVLSGRAVPLAEGVVRAMFLTRLQIAALLMLIAGLLIAGGILTRQALVAAPADEAREAKPHSGPAVVHVVKPQPGGLERVTTQPCQVEAFAKVDITAAVSGRLKAQAVDLGDVVKKGQLLAEIDAPLLDLEEKQATAAVQQARAAVHEAEARIAIARAGVGAAEHAVVQKEAEVEPARAALSFREQQLTRMEDLFKQKSIEERVVEERRDQMLAARGQASAAAAAVKTAQAELEIQKSKVVQAEAGLQTARADLDAAGVTLEKAQYTRGLARIVSPVDGVITRRNFSEGQHVQQGGLGSAVALLTVQRTDRLRVVTAVPDRDVPSVHPGLRVGLTLDALPGVSFADAKVSRIGFAEDPATHTMRVEIDVPNPTQQLRPGMYGTATLHLGPGPADALRLPASALVRKGPGEPGAVYVVRDGKAHRTPVQVGTSNGKEMEVLSGLKPDDLVVTDPDGLRGDVVPVKRTEKPAPK
jgi:RNA polymerase sigma factor (sigma-70 family)